MRKKIRYLYTDPLHRNSIAMMLNPAFAAFFGLVLDSGGADNAIEGGMG